MEFVNPAQQTAQDVKTEPSVKNVIKTSLDSTVYVLINVQKTLSMLTEIARNVLKMTA
jgi:hypothetical protein